MLILISTCFTTPGKNNSAFRWIEWVSPFKRLHFKAGQKVFIPMICNYLTNATKFKVYFHNFSFEIWLRNANFLPFKPITFTLMKKLYSDRSTLKATACQYSYLESAFSFDTFLFISHINFLFFRFNVLTL
jgi:hypothetical protein